MSNSSFPFFPQRHAPTTAEVGADEISLCARNRRHDRHGCGEGRGECTAFNSYECIFHEEREITHQASPAMLIAAKNTFTLQRMKGRNTFPRIYKQTNALCESYCFTCSLPFACCSSPPTVLILASNAPCVFSNRFARSAYTRLNLELNLAVAVTTSTSRFLACRLCSRRKERTKNLPKRSFQEAFEHRNQLLNFFFAKTTQLQDRCALSRNIRVSVKRAG